MWKEGLIENDFSKCVCCVQHHAQQPHQTMWVSCFFRHPVHLFLASPFIAYIAIPCIFTHRISMQMGNSVLIQSVRLEYIHIFHSIQLHSGFARSRDGCVYSMKKKYIYSAEIVALYCDMNIWMACTLVVSHKWWWKVLHVVALSTHSLHCIISIYSVCCVWQCKMQSAVRSSECWWRLFISTAIPLVIFIDIVRCNTNAVLLSFDGFR